MAKRYSDAIRIRETKSAYNIQTEESNEWKNFIPNEQFNEILQKIIASVSNKVVDEHRSFWLEGTYGTGKSHAAALGDAEFPDAHVVDGSTNFFDEINKFRIVAFAALQSHRSVAGL